MGLDMYLYAKKAIPASAEGYSQLLAGVEERRVRRANRRFERQDDGYISGYHHGPATLALALQTATGLTMNDHSPHGHVTLHEGILLADVCIGYWRKANAVHHWFVVKVAGGVDECKPVEVTREQLAELHSVCRGVIDHPNTALELLPPKEGSFFGITSCDEHYFDDLRDTVRQLGHALAHDPDVTFIYRASW